MCRDNQILRQNRLELYTTSELCLEIKRRIFKGFPYFRNFKNEREDINKGLPGEEVLKYPFSSLVKLYPKKSHG